MNKHGDVNGDETESSRDFKKILKLFFRWVKLGSRDFKEMGDPDETKKIRLRKPKDKITRGEFAQRRRSCKTFAFLWGKSM